MYKKYDSIKHGRRSAQIKIHMYRKTWIHAINNILISHIVAM